MENHSHKTKIAQAATELAVFGAILLFLIGGLIRVGFQQSMTMNQQLRALRLALSESWRTSQGEYSDGVASISRSPANIMIIEDRLSVDAGQKMGTRDRIPFVATGSGTFTQNMFYSFEPWIERDIPVLDIFVNGQRFPLTIARYRTDVPLPSPASLLPCQNAAGHPTDTRCKEEECIQAPAPLWDSSTTYNVNDYVIYNLRRYRAIQISQDKNPASELTYWTEQNAYSPCIIFFRREFNYYRNIKFDKMEALGDDPGSDPKFHIRFDLKFEGTPNSDLNMENFRGDFTWQWVPVAAVSADTDLAATVEAWGTEKLAPKKDEPVLVDIDGDFEMEAVYTTTNKPNGSVETVNYLDSQGGDINMGYKPEGLEDSVGIQVEAQMFSYTASAPKWGAGTYYRIEQGEIRTLSGRFIRNTTRNDHVDLVMRILRLSNDTGRFCSGGTPVAWGGSVNCGAAGLCGLTNPVKVCIPKGTTCVTVDGNPLSCCFEKTGTVNAIEQTCMDLNDNTIYIRSLLKNIKGSRWITRVDLR